MPIDYLFRSLDVAPAVGSWAIVIIETSQPNEEWIQMGPFNSDLQWVSVY
jgi:hypothetical protein